MIGRLKHKLCGKPEKHAPHTWTEEQHATRGAKAKTPIRHVSYFCSGLPTVRYE